MSRKFKLILLSSLGASLCCTPAAAQRVTTCSEFRTELYRAIANAGDRVARPTIDRIAFERKDGSFRRYRLEGVVGLDGNLQCEAEDRLLLFEVSVEVEGRDDAVKVHRLNELSTATICAISPNLMTAGCREWAKKLSTAAVREFSKSSIRGDPDPAETIKATISGFDIEVDASSGALGFSIRPAVR